MKLHLPTKMIFTVLALMLIFAAVFVFINRQKLRKIPVNSTAAEKSQPKGTCNPDTVNCQGNAKLCMELNKNKVCNQFVNKKTLFILTIFLLVIFLSGFFIFKKIPVTSKKVNNLAVHYSYFSQKEFYDQDSKEKKLNEKNACVRHEVASCVEMIM